MRKLAAFLFIAGGLKLPAEQPPSLMTDYNRAWQLTGERRAAEAIPLLKQIIARDKTFHHAYKTLAAAYWEKKDLDSAESYFKGVLIQDPGNGLAFYGLGEVSRLQKHHEAAVERYSACIRRTPDAYACYQPLVNELASARHNAISLQELRKHVPLDSSLYSHLAVVEQYYIRRNLGEAIRAAERGLTLASAAKDAEVRGLLEQRLGWCYSAYGDREIESLDHYQKALRIYERLDLTEERLKTAVYIGRSYLRLGETATALRSFEGSALLARELHHHTWIALTQLALGQYYAYQGDHERALGFYHQAETECDRSGIENPIDSILQGIGAAYEAQGDLTGALQAFENYRRWASEVGDAWSEAFARRRMGDVYRDSGEYFKALESLRRALQMFRDIGRSDNAGATLRVMASVHTALGNYATAIEDYRESLQEAAKIHDAEQQERIHLGLGELYLRMNRAAPALFEFQEALKVSERTVYTNLRSRTLLRMGESYSLLGAFDQAANCLNEGLRRAQRIHSPVYEAHALAGLGELDLRRGKLASAEVYFRNSLSLAEPVGLTEVVLTARRGLGESRAKEADYEEALRHLKMAVETVESLRARAPTPELKSDFVQENWKTYQDTIDVLSRLHARQPSLGYERQAFDYAERGRARSFLDLLTESGGSLPGLSPQQQARRASLVAAISNASKALLKEGSDKNRQTLRKTEQNLDQWALDLRLTNPKYQELQYTEPDDTARIQSALSGSGTAILEYTLGERRSLLWAISESRFQMVILPGRQILAKEVATLRALASRPPKGGAALDAYQESARRLYQRFVSPVEDTLRGARNILIVPDGILFYLPFEALIRPGTGRPHYLIEEFTLAYAPSASVFRKLSARETRRGHKERLELLAYGDPVFAAGQGSAGRVQVGDLVRSSYRAGGFAFAPLPNTRTEVEGLRRLFPAGRSTIYLGSQATESSVKGERLTDYKVVHFATHAVIDEDVPARSGVVLSLVNTGDEDGILRAAEILSLDLDADLVVLSACQTGLGRLVRGEGMVGLTQAFLYAGSPRVVVSLWEINDLGTADFMKMFYQEIKAGRVPAAALREAKLAMIRSNTPAYQQPYFWSAFILVGTF